MDDAKSVIRKAAKMNGVKLSEERLEEIIKPKETLTNWTEEEKEKKELEEENVQYAGVSKQTTRVSIWVLIKVRLPM